MHILKNTASSSLSLPAENYIYSITAASPGSSFAAISSDDSLRVFDSNDIRRVSVVAPKTHSNGVTALEPYQQQQQVLVTGGRDGKVKVWDLRKGNGDVAVEIETGEFLFVLSILAACFMYMGYMFKSYDCRLTVNSKEHPRFIGSVQRRNQHRCCRHGIGFVSGHCCVLVSSAPSRLEPV